MLMVFVAMAFMSAFGLIVRRSQRAGHDMIVVGLINYAVPTLFYGIWSASAGLWTCDPRAALIGVIGGAIYGVGFLTLLGPMAGRGVSIVSAILGLSVLVPVVLSLVVWQESLLPVQAVGAVLALAALPLLGMGKGTGGTRLTLRMALLMVALFLINGGAMAVQKWFHTTGLTQQRPVFLLYLFGSACLVLTVAWLTRRQPFTVKSVGWGAALGCSNMMAALTLLTALDYLPGLVVFPVVQVGILILSTLFAAVVWREKPGRLGMVGIGIACVAVTLLNLS